MRQPVILCAMCPDARQIIYSCVRSQDCVGGEQRFLSLISSSETPAVVIPLKRHIVRALVASCTICQAGIHYIFLCETFRTHRQQRPLSFSRAFRSWHAERLFPARSQSFEFRVISSFVLAFFKILIILMLSFQHICVFVVVVVVFYVFHVPDDFNLWSVLIFLLCYSGCNQWHNGSFLQWHWFI